MSFEVPPRLACEPLAAHELDIALSSQEVGNFLRRAAHEAFGVLQAESAAESEPVRFALEDINSVFCRENGPMAIAGVMPYLVTYTAVRVEENGMAPNRASR
jgi:hypothetical protein